MPEAMMPESMMPEPLGILLITGSYERAHYAFMLAAGAAAIGRPVTLFATNDGCRALLRDWSSLQDASRDIATRNKGIADFDTLRDAASELGVRLMACEAGLLLAALDPADLLPDVEIAGIPTFLAGAACGIITL